MNEVSVHFNYPAIEKTLRRDNWITCIDGTRHGAARAFVSDGFHRIVFLLPIQIFEFELF